MLRLKKKGDNSKIAQTAGKEEKKEGLIVLHSQIHHGGGLAGVVD